MKLFHRPKEATVTIEPIDTTNENLELTPVCPHCFGTGRILTTNDLLRESVQLLGTDSAVHQNIIVIFYGNLLAKAPDMIPLFPRDLLDPESSGPGKVQRDRLLAALLALGQGYNPENPRAMEVLNTHLATFGRAHAAFRRPDGTVQGATVLEYAAVWEALGGVLVTLPGWESRFTKAWMEAYNYAAQRMISAQVSMESTAFGRFPRENDESTHA